MLTIKFMLCTIAVSLSTLIIFGCAKQSYSSPTASHSGLKQLSARKGKSQSVSPLKVQMLRDTALSVGARGGLAHRAKEINKITEKHSKLLNRVFNFYGMMLDDNVLPPVLTEGRHSLNLASNDVIRLADRNYKIVKQARFVTAVPNWREYLVLNYQTPEAQIALYSQEAKRESGVGKIYR